MNQQRTPAKRMSYREWKIRKCLRLARNWVLFLAACGGAVALMATGILWLLPKAHALIAGPVPFAARAYSADGYVCDTDDARLVVVNANLPLESEPAPELAVADDATGEQLETEAAAAYRSMAEAAQAAGVELNLVTGWQDADTRTAAYEARLTAYQTENSRQQRTLRRCSRRQAPASRGLATAPISSRRTARSARRLLPRPAPTSG